MKVSYPLSIHDFKVLFSAAIYQRSYKINTIFTQFLKSVRVICEKENNNIYIYYSVADFTNLFCCLNGKKKDVIY